MNAGECPTRITARVGISGGAYAHAMGKRCYWTCPLQDGFVAFYINSPVDATTPARWPDWRNIMTTGAFAALVGGSAAATLGKYFTQ